MKSKLNVALLLALSVGASGKLAMAQDKVGDLRASQAQSAVFHPQQTGAALQLTAGRDRDGDHDRDDRNRRGNDRDRDDRYRNHVYRNNGPWGANNNGYWGNNGWYGNSGAYRNNGYYNNGYTVRNGQRGWYDNNGNFHLQGTNGYYDRNGYWHSR
jgi:hypothetical protein